VVLLVKLWYRGLKGYLKNKRVRKTVRSILMNHFLSFCLSLMCYVFFLYIFTVELTINFFFEILQFIADNK